jgi:hypothetical protein
MQDALIDDGVPVEMSKETNVRRAIGFHDDELVEGLIRAGCMLWLPKLDQAAPAELSNDS